MFSFAISLLFIGIVNAESECPCEEKLYDVTVSVDPMKSQNTKEFALYAYENVYNTSEIFMRKQGMNLVNFAEQYHFVDPEEPCYFGVVAGGEYALDDGTGIASIADIEFRLQTTEDSLSATICRCKQESNPGINICEKLHENLQERLAAVKAKLEG